MRLVWGTVTAEAGRREGLQRLTVELDDETQGQALCYESLSGVCEVGDRVLLNTTAVDLSLGTGGVHMVVARLGKDGESPSGVALDDPSGGHIMKLRYTPLQRDFLSVEAPESPHHSAIADTVDVDGMPVVCCSLHSHVPIVAASIRQGRPEARIAYLMTDEAALPLALSDVVSQAVAAGLIDITITCGQAFGGRLEAVNLHSGLIAARHVAKADVAIVAIGPGVVGTGTALGHGGVAQGEAVNAVASVGGRPVVALRMSFADARERHRGVSHHTLTVLSRVTLASARVAVPQLDAALMERVDADLTGARVWDRHERVSVKCAMPDMRGLPVRSMGRGPEDDPAFFIAAAAAGAVAADLL